VANGSQEREIGAVGPPVVTTPSLGVGYEIGRAVEWGKRVICLYRPSTERRLSGMIAGCGGILVRTYTDTAQLPSILKEALAIS